MDVLEDLGPDHGMQVCLHEVEHQVDIFVIFGLYEMLETHNVGMAVELSQKNHLAEGALGIGRILECIEHFFDSYHISGLLVDGFPDHAVSSLA